MDAFNSDVNTINWERLLSSNLNASVENFNAYMHHLFNSYAPKKKIVVRERMLPWFTYNVRKMMRLRDEAHHRKGRSTATALLDVVDDVLAARDAGEGSILALLDFSRAFDTVDIQLLLAKLVYYGFDCNTIKWFSSYLSGRVQQVEELAKITGSCAYERFTGPQIRKMRRVRPRIYQAAERISLVSSFACSLFLGKIAPIDLSDGSGMNLLDIHSKKWCQRALEACGDETLESKLGEPVPTASHLGPISSYFVKRYGFDPKCSVVAFTGDNCSALAGLQLRSGWVGLSLGTSDTLLLGLQETAAPPAGHVLVGPTPDAPYMALLCFANGSLTRQNHRDRLAGNSWDAFNDLLRATVRGNMGYMDYLETNGILPSKQSGFRKGRSTATALLDVVDDVLAARDA
ncbi:xylulose kinase-like, partial [Hyposmocoma kahamanoa]|uniref:xylulose kinase-like n=1 Tax=Hyposmocoma kahamanoa TaxID=1477025 RepID=UPI000E6D8BDB